MKFLSRQFVDYSHVRPEQRFVGGKFYLNSPAGSLSFKPKTVKETSSFRDEFINRFESISDERDFFDLYAEIRKKYGIMRVSYSANVRTRFRGRVFGLYSKVLG